MQVLQAVSEPGHPRATKHQLSCEPPKNQPSNMLHTYRMFNLENASAGFLPAHLQEMKKRQLQCLLAQVPSSTTRRSPSCNFCPFTVQLTLWSLPMLDWEWKDSLSPLQKVSCVLSLEEHSSSPTIAMVTTTTTCPQPRHKRRRLEK